MENLNIWALICFCILTAFSVFFGVKFLENNKRKQTSKDPKPLRKSITQNRTTDRLDVSVQDQQTINEAESLAQNGEFLRAAKLLEKLGMPRQAIQLLEEFGAVEEACTILVKMNRPNRAGVVFERHHKFLKAAEQFLLANMPEDAARCFMEEGAKNGEYFLKAANLYESSEQYAQAFLAYEAAGNLPAMLQLCLKHQLWESLKDLLDNPKNTVETVELMTPVDIKKFIKTLKINPDSARSLAQWCHLSHRKELINATLKLLVNNPAVCSHFWTHLPDDFVKSTCPLLVQAAQSHAPEWVVFVMKHANCLFESKRYQHAATLYQSCERFLMVFKCEVHLGHYPQALNALQNVPQEQKQLKEVMHQLKKAKITNIAAIEKNSIEEKVLKEILEKTFELGDTEADSREVESPFTLSA